MSLCILKLDNINKVKNNNIILNNISLEVNEGEIVGILSNSNDAKNALLRIIVKLVKPTSGTISFMNHNLYKEFNKSINLIGIATDLIYKRNSTVLEFLNLTNSFYKADYTNNINKYIEIFKLDKDKKLNDLTKYERKALSLINAIFFNPKLLIIDELDKDLCSLNKAIITNVLNDLKNNGTAILYLAESLDLSNIADSLYILKDGSIICDNTLELKSYKYINGYTTDIKKLNEFEVLNLEVINNNVSFIYRGNVEKILHNMNLNNITISQPHIMDIEGLYEQNTIQE